MSESIKKYVVSFGIVLVISLIGLICYFDKNEYEEEKIVSIADEITTTSNIEKKSDYFYVDIKGAVKKQGVYKATEGMIVNDIIKLAGGLKSNAYVKNINLSKKVFSEMVIYIYNKSEIKTTNSTTSIILNDVLYTTTKPSDVISTTTENNTSDITTNTTTENTTTNKININQASKSELMTLPGVGSSKADLIIAYRLNTPYLSIEEIKNVKGIGDAMYEQIKDLITV